MQLNNQANYLGLVFLRIDNIGAYVSLFNLHFTVEQQHLSPRTSTVPRLPVTAQKPPQAGLGGTRHLPADTSLSLEVPSTTQADTAPPALEQELQEGTGSNRTPSVPTWLRRQRCFPGTAIRRLPEEHARPCLQHTSSQAFFLLFFLKIKKKTKKLDKKFHSLRLCIRRRSRLPSASHSAPSAPDTTCTCLAGTREKHGEVVEMLIKGKKFI